MNTFTVRQIIPPTPPIYFSEAWVAQEVLFFVLIDYVKLRAKDETVALCGSLRRRNVSSSDLWGPHVVFGSPCITHHGVMIHRLRTTAMVLVIWMIQECTWMCSLDSNSWNVAVQMSKDAKQRGKSFYQSLYINMFILCLS